MNTKYTIKNFRVFDEKGVTVDIKPITILTGCNNSGKSSIVKSMVLFDTYIKSLLNDYKAFNRLKFINHKLDFSSESTSSLGNFNQILCRNSDSKEISFEYSVHSILLGEDVSISMTFYAQEKDVLNEGYIKELRICKSNGDVLYLSSREIPCEVNCNLIIDNFYRFIRGQYLVDQYRKYEAKHHEIYGEQSEEEYQATMNDLAHEASEQWIKQQEKEVNVLKESINRIEKLESDFIDSYGKDALIDIITWSNRYGYDYSDLLCVKDQENVKTLIDQFASIEVVNQSYNRKTFFYCHLMDVIGSLSSEDFKSGLLKEMGNVKLGKEIYMAIDNIEEDFAASKCKFFVDYYKKKEYEFLVMSLPEKDRILGSPFLIGDFTRPHFHNEPIEGYLNHILNTIDEGTYNNDAPVDFSQLYDFIMYLNAIREKSYENEYYIVKDNREDFGPYKKFEHRLYRMFNEYLPAVLREIVLSSIPNSIEYVPTSLINIKRLYALDAKDDFTTLLKQYLEERRKFTPHPGFFPGIFINKWIKKFEIGESISIDADLEGLGVCLRLHKDSDDKKGSLLAEQGYGITQLFAILLRIEIAIMRSKSEVVNKKPYDLGHPKHYWKEESDVLVNYYESTIAVEEPEVHLHPNFQSMLAEMFYDAYTNFNVHFIIETHSEYLIRKLQVMVADKEIPLMSDDISLNYIEKEDSGSSNRKIDILEDGRLNEPFGPGFFDEADSLAMEILKYKARRR